MTIPNTNPIETHVCASCKAQFVPDSHDELQCYNCKTMEELINRHKKVKKTNV